MHGTDRHTLETINDPPALREQGQIVASFHERYGNTGLTVKDFMPPDMNVAISCSVILRYLPTHTSLSNVPMCCGAAAYIASEKTR